MRKPLNEEAIIDKFTRIIGASAYCRVTNQMADALLNLFDRAEKPEQVIRLTLAECDRTNPLKTHKYTFPPAWNMLKMGMITGAYGEYLEKYVQMIIKESNGSIDDATKMITGTLKHLEGDERTAFFIFMLTEVCPFNFYVSSEKGLTTEEADNVSLNSPSTQELYKVLTNRTEKRFPTVIDKADYIATLMSTVSSRRELVTFLAMMEFWAKQVGALESAEQHRAPVVGGVDDFMREMGEKPTLPPELAELMMAGLPVELRHSGVRVHVMRASDIFSDGIRAYRAEHAAREQGEQPEDERSG